MTAFPIRLSSIYLVTHFPTLLLDDGGILSVHCPKRWTALALSNDADYDRHGSGVLGLPRGQEMVVGKWKHT